MDNDVKQKLEDSYNKAIAAEHEKLKSTHTKKEFTFTVTERRRIAQQQVIATMANKAIQDIMDFNVLPRISVEIDPNLVIMQDANVGRLTVWIPKPANRS